MARSMVLSARSQHGLCARLDSEEGSMRGPAAGTQLGAVSVLVMAGLVMAGLGDASPPGRASVVPLETVVPREIGCRAWQQT